MTIFECLNNLIHFAKRRLDLKEQDVSFVTNYLLDTLRLGYWQDTPVSEIDDVALLLEQFTQTAVEQGIFEKQDGAYYCDKIMGVLSNLPSVVDDKFQAIKTQSGSKVATEWLYDYCVNNNYVKKSVLDKNPRFDSNGLVVTINLAKPEFRDPNKAKAGNSVAGGYPKCVICRENEGLLSRNKGTLRTVSLTLDGKPWFWQFSPYGYFYQHGIAVNCNHTPMKVDKQTFVNLLDFVDQFPHYFIGCNAALERIGGSVLAHDHYQGGGEILPMHKAQLKTQLFAKGYEDLQIGVVDWPGTVLRISGTDKEKIVELSNVVATAWANFTDEKQNLRCKTGDARHHSVSPTVVKRGNEYEMSIILRSNLTSQQYPDGIYHAHPEYHVIKKESIGLIEAQGLFILPGRLVDELQQVKQCVVCGKLSEQLKQFDLVYKETLVLYNGGLDVDEAMQCELGSICYRILQNTAVFASEKQFLTFLAQSGIKQR